MKKLTFSIPAKRTSFVAPRGGDRKCGRCGKWIGRDENPCPICGYDNG